MLREILSEKQYPVALLRWGEGLPHKLIAVRLNMKRPTVTRLLSRAKQRLAEKGFPVHALN